MGQELCWCLYNFSQRFFPQGAKGQKITTKIKKKINKDIQCSLEKLLYTYTSDTHNTNVIMGM